MQLHWKESPMSCDIDYRYRRALQPDGLTTYENALIAVNEAIADAKLAGRKPADCPGVRLLTRHLSRIAEGEETHRPDLDAHLREQCMTRVAELRHTPAIIALVRRGIVPADWPVTINAVSGYSGGGKKMIAGFEDPTAPDRIDTPFRVYGLNLGHKHIPEIQYWSELKRTPIFVPSVGRYREGMIVQVPLHLGALPGGPSAEALHDILAAHYEGRRFVTVADLVKGEGAPVLDPDELNGTNELRLHVYASKDGAQAVVCGVLDNLGMGASGQAVQCLNLMLGLDQATGLN